MWTKADPGEHLPRREVISQRGFRRIEVCTGGIIGDDVVMIVDENTGTNEKRRILLDYEEAAGVVTELQRFIDGEDDFRKNYKEVV